MSKEYSRKPPEDPSSCPNYSMQEGYAACCNHPEGPGYCAISYGSSLKPCPLAIGTIYFASPFFNKTEEAFVDLAVKELRNLCFKVFSPKEEGGIIGKDVPKEAAQEIFDNNIKAIQASSIVIANIDNFDPGTIWEIGYAHALNKKIITISPQGYGLNIMLTKSSIAHYQSLVTMLAEMRYYRRTGETPHRPWKGDVV